MLEEKYYSDEFIDQFAGGPFKTRLNDNIITNDEELQLHLALENSFNEQKTVENCIVKTTITPQKRVSSNDWLTDRIQFLNSLSLKDRISSMNQMITFDNNKAENKRELMRQLSGINQMDNNKKKKTSKAKKAYRKRCKIKKKYVPFNSLSKEQQLDIVSHILSNFKHKSIILGSIKMIDLEHPKEPYLPLGIMMIFGKKRVYELPFIELVTGTMFDLLTNYKEKNKLKIRCHHYDTELFVQGLSNNDIIYILQHCDINEEVYQKIHWLSHDCEDILINFYLSLYKLKYIAQQQTKEISDKLGYEILNSAGYFASEILDLIVSHLFVTKYTVKTMWHDNPNKWDKTQGIMFPPKPKDYI